MAIVDDEHPINEAAHTNDLHLSQTPNTTIATHFPPIGSDYDFVEPQNWPADIVYLKYNVFEGSQPFPVSHQSSSYNSKCGCDYHRCIPANTTRLTSRCVNAGMDLICDATTCSGGQTCGNRFQQCFVLDLIATKVGFGVVCNTTIPNGSFVIEYVGEVLLRDAALNRYDRRYQVELKVKTTWGKRVALFIDARNGGNESRFINHCCEPNCALYEYQWTNTVRLGIFATSDIPPLQELTFRYREENISLFECQCSRTSCVSQLE
ncbi:hypothetical protein PHMEG_00031816 [Phytophthora megakarya]|uniref:SET domain-containing protein n=1 Tax=Phytophthora megakarya TaxID=4795 RepID=A0A225UWT4_9STRA|nr:hypothetical protein PHMEG_00031816 [Phytophthora megakarya]